jgi:hypothetical protein
MRAGYSAVEPGAWIRPHYGETNAQLKLHFGLTIPTDSRTAGQPCALLRVGGSGNATDTSAAAAGGGAGGEAGDGAVVGGWTVAASAGDWRGWPEGGVLLFDDSYEHEVRMQPPPRPSDHVGEAGDTSGGGGGGGGEEEGGGCTETRVVLQLVLRHPDLWDGD